MEQTTLKALTAIVERSQLELKARQHLEMALDRAIEIFGATRLATALAEEKISA